MLVSQSTQITVISVIQSILPLQINQFINDLLKAGKISEILYLRKKNLSFQFSSNLKELLQMIPKHVSLSSFTELMMFYLEKERNLLSFQNHHQHSSTSSSQTAYLHKMLLAVREVYQRCKLHCLSVSQSSTSVVSNDDDGNRSSTETVDMFDPIRVSFDICPILTTLFASTSFVIVDDDDDNNDSSDFIDDRDIDNDNHNIQQEKDILLQEIKQFQNHLKVILLSKELLELSAISLSEIIEIEMKGLLFHCLKTVSVSELSFFISTKLIVFLNHFHCNCDELLFEWIEENIQEYLLSTGGKEDEDISQEESFSIHPHLSSIEEKAVNIASLSRIITVLSNVKNPINATTMLLKVFNIPMIESLSIFHQTSSEAPSVTLSDQLLALGSTLSKTVDSPLYDSLSESMRLFRMKCISLRYGIESFDLKDRDHLSAALSIILNSIEISLVQRLEDVLAFAMDGNTMRIDCSPVLLRMLISFFQSSTSSLSSSNDAEGNQLKEFLAKIPKSLLSSSHLVIDAITFCCDQINYHCDNNIIVNDDEDEDVNTKMDEEERKEIKDGLQQYTTGCIRLLEYSDDTSSSLTTGLLNSASSMQTNNHQFSKPHLSSVNIHLLSDLKKIHQLQVNFDMYLNLYNVRSSNDCKKIIETITTETINKWKKTSGSLVSSASASSEDQALSSLCNDCLKLKKICSILQCSSQIYVLFVSKLLLAAGKKVSKLFYSFTSVILISFLLFRF
jgi:hypothetical protein